MNKFNPNIIRVISLDLTGTIFEYSHSIGQIYSAAAQKTNFPVALDPQATYQAFKTAYKRTSQQYPCFGYHHNLSERQWWEKVVLETLNAPNPTTPIKPFSDSEFDSFFRKVYQDFASLPTYTLYPDAVEFLGWLRDSKYVRGVLTNAPLRTVESILPLLSYHDHFHYTVSCCDVGYEKPDSRLFDHAYKEAKRLLPDLRKEEILHVGDDFKLDYLGAINAGYQGIRIARGESGAIEEHRVQSLVELISLLS